MKHRWSLIGLLRDVRFAARFLRRNPLFAATAILTLALGTGATTAVFSATYAVVLRSLPFPTAGRLTEFRSYHPSAAPEGSPYFSRPAVNEIGERTRSFEHVAHYLRATVTLTGSGEPQDLTGLIVSGAFFACYGVDPVLGRYILPTDTEGDTQIAVISYGLWQKLFGGDTTRPLESLSVTLAVQPSLSFTTFAPRGRSYRVIGVMPPQDRFPIDGDLWLPLAKTAYTIRMGPSPRSARTVSAIGVLRRDVTIGEANAELALIASGLSTEHPDTDKGWDIRTRPLRRAEADAYDRILYLLLAAVHALVVLACVSISGLFVARNRSRQIEVAVKESLGATQVRIVRQSLIEAGLVAFLGGALGVILAWSSLRIAASLNPEASVLRGSLQWAVLVYALLLVVACSLIVGLAPLFLFRKRSIAEALKGRQASSELLSGPRPIRFRGMLICAQIALAVPLLMGSLLTVRTLKNLIEVDVGYLDQGILVLQPRLSTAVCGRPDQCLNTITDILDRFRATPGVTHAALTAARPLSTAFAMRLVFENMPRADDHRALFGIVTPDYFATMGIPVRAGRPFTDADIGTSPRVAIVNTAFARRYLGGSGVGHRVSLERAGMPGWIEIVGEVADTRDIALTREPEPTFYIPMRQSRAIPRTVFVVRTDIPTADVATQLRRELWAVDRNAPVVEIKSLQQLRTEAVAIPRVQAVVLTFFATIGLLLAVLGTYGLVSHTVAERLREMGIRIALGAGGRDIVRLILRESLAAIGAGLVLGAVGALVLSRFAGHMVFGLSPYDPVSLLAVLVLVGVVALIAYYVPARRATHVDPIRILRSE